MEEIMTDVRTQKRLKYLRELSKSKDKEKTFRKIATETMVMFSERRMLLKDGDKQRFNLKKHYHSINEVYKDDKLVFNRVCLFLFSELSDPQDDVHCHHTPIFLRCEFHLHLPAKLQQLQSGKFRRESTQLKASGSP